MILGSAIVAMIQVTTIMGLIHLGDSSAAAIIAATASIVNGLILVNARGTQRHTRDQVAEVQKHVKQAANDTDLRGEQIDELRSLSKERWTQIHELERVADRFSSLLRQMDTVTERRSQPRQPPRGRGK